MKIGNFIKDWSLIIAMMMGVASYFAYVSIPWLDCTHAFATQAVAFMQPALIFAMLFVTFCRIDIRRMRLCRWHLWLLLIQGALFAGIGLFLIILPHSSLRIVLEGAMILLICPTATAAPVITKKLGGDITRITTYTILINLLAAVLIPVMVPYVHHNPGMSIANASLMILGKVFPLLLFPLLGAILLKALAPKAHRKLAEHAELSFYLWLVALALAIAITTRSIMHTQVSISTQLWLVVVSLACCQAQFWMGWKIGSRYGDRITAGQAMGQKNTVLAIWLGYTFFSPITSIAGGFYSIWHNLINSYQLFEHKKRFEKKEINRNNDNTNIHEQKP